MNDKVLITGTAADVLQTVREAGVISILGICAYIGEDFATVRQALRELQKAGAVRKHKAGMFTPVA